MGAIAAREALERAGVGADDVDCVIFATLSPDVDMPSTACVLQSHLGIGGMPAFDVRNQCSGFLYSLATANAFIKSGASSACWWSAPRCIRPASTSRRAAATWR